MKCKHCRVRVGKSTGRLGRCLWNRETERRAYLGIQRGEQGKHVQGLSSRVEANASEAGATVDVDPGPSGTATILLVEDEAALREVASEYLRAKGYQVLEAETGQAAVELSKSHRGPIDLLITVVVMPGISGTSVVEAVSEFRPGLPAILMSGFTDRTIGPDLLGPRTIFMQKPFSLDALARKIHAIPKDKS